MLNGAHEQAFQRVSQVRPPAPGWNRPGQAWNPSQAWPQGAQGAQRAQGPQGPQGGNEDGDYDHYNVEGSDPALRRDRARAGGFDEAGGDITSAAISMAMEFAARAVGRQMKRGFQQRVVPAMQDKAAQVHQQWEESKAEQDAIVARYPELRGCVKDWVIFLDGGRRAVPIAELKMPVTLARADVVVAKLRLRSRARRSGAAGRRRAGTGPFGRLAPRTAGSCPASPHREVARRSPPCR